MGNARNLSFLLCILFGDETFLQMGTKVDPRCVLATQKDDEPMIGVSNNITDSDKYV